MDDYYFCPLRDDEPEHPCCLIERGRWEKMMEFMKDKRFRGFKNLTGSNRFIKILIGNQERMYGNFSTCQGRLSEVLD